MTKDNLRLANEIHNKISEYNESLRNAKVMQNPSQEQRRGKNYLKLRFGSI